MFMGIELPPLGAEPAGQVGSAVPSRLRKHWHVIWRS